MRALLLAFLKSHVKAVGVSVAIMACGGAVVAGVHRYRDAQRERGRLEVRAQQLDSMLHVEQQRTARADTVRTVAVKRFTQTVERWNYDTVRLEILAQPDTAVVPVLQYRRLSDALDSVVVAAAAALSAADSLAMQERREKLLWRAKAEQRTPVITMPSADRWQRRRERAVIAALAGVVIYQAVKR